MATVYVVTTGEYSDYRIRGVFDNRGLAEGFRARLQHPKSLLEANDIEEWILNHIPKWAELGRHAYYVVFDQAANVARCDTHECQPLDEDNLEDSRCGYSNKAREEVGVWLWAKDPAQAIKVASEKRAKFLAEQGAKDD